MTARVIRIPRELYQSLPAIYQNIARIGAHTGQVVLVDERDFSDSPENDSEPEVHSKTMIHPEKEAS